MRKSLNLSTLEALRRTHTLQTALIDLVRAKIDPGATSNATEIRRVFFYDLTREPLQYLIRSHFRFQL